MPSTAEPGVSRAALAGGCRASRGRAVRHAAEGESAASAAVYGLEKMTLLNEARL